MLQPTAGLFERISEDADGACLPRADAPPEQLVACGRVLMKALLDDHPIGRGLAPFAIEYLIDEGRRALADPPSALDALAAVDSGLAENFRGILDGIKELPHLGLVPGRMANV